ncbi:MAG TPA: lipopolysaccharide heptosyltransferase II [Thermodesulfovibrionia bacterium]|nr:lipopolysaccharide heptosyltransferase II [Thermodesulfovibrionia bacterium]
MKILIIKPSSLGDVIHSLPFLKTIKNTFPDAEIEWVISKNLKEILEGNPLINRLIVFDKDSWTKIGNLSKTVREAIGLINILKSGHYDMVVDLQGLLRSGLITFFASSPLKVGFKNAREGSSIFYNKKISVNGSLHAVDRCLEIAKAIRQELGARGQSTTHGGLGKAEFPLNVDKTAAENIKKLLGGLKEKEYVVVIPSARWKTKRWSPENFGTLISKLSVPCIVTGSKADEQIVKEVMRFSNGKGTNFCGKTDLKELTALIAGAKAVVSNDSGPMHIAAAIGVPIIALFGPTDPYKTGPYGWSGIRAEQEKKNLRVIRALISCSPCFKKKCKDLLCMDGISVRTVLKELEEYI